MHPLQRLPICLRWKWQHANIMERFVRSWSPLIFDFIGCLYTQQLFLTTCGASLEVVFGFEWRRTYFGSLRAKFILAPLVMPKWIWPSMNRKRILKPTYYLQACTKNFLILEGVVCRLTNSWLKVMLSSRITLMPSARSKHLQLLICTLKGVVILICDVTFREVLKY